MKLITLLLPLAANGAVVKLGKLALFDRTNKCVTNQHCSGAPNTTVWWQLGSTCIFGCRSRTCGSHVAQEEGNEDRRDPA
jgi:hypothetical protein